MDGSLVVSQVEFVLKNDESCAKALRVLAEEVFPFKVTREGLVVLEELVLPALLVAYVALVVLFIEMFVQLHRKDVKKMHGSVGYQDANDEYGKHIHCTSRVLTYLGDVIKSPRAAKLTKGMAGKAAARPVTLGLMDL